MNTTERQIQDITELLAMLDEEMLKEIKNFTHFLIEKQKKREAFENHVLQAEQEPPIRFKTVQEAMKAIRNEAGI
ncbi:MAG: hypothetical protein N3A62_00820 [Thermodesulfovibrionales bacterium]|nr:hypothetical protein [Thermodesulfovibrionales bacterium]